MAPNLYFAFVKNETMKTIALIAAMAATTFFYGQEVKTNEENVSFSNGTHNAIVVTIPYGNKDVVEKELKSELKDWGGKFNSSKGEMQAMGASSKAMGNKIYDGYAKIISENEKEIRVAFAIDLGGAYLDSRQHNDQYKVMNERIKKFGKNAANESINEEIAVEAKVLKELEGNKSDLEKSIEESKKDIEDYKKRIAEEEQKIKDNEAALTKKGEEITTQTSKLGDVEKKKKAIN